MSVLVDSSVFVAAFNRSDKLHRKARRLLSGLLQGSHGPVFTLDYIVDEVLTYMASRGGADAALKAGRFFFEKRAVRILPVSMDLFEAAWLTFKRHLPTLSFTDAALLEAAKAYRIDYIATYDSGLAGLYPSIG